MSEKLYLRKANPDDLDQIMVIIKQAQLYLKDLNINQWQNNYPNKEVILNDILNKNGYVLIKKAKIIATVALIFDKEPTYAQIFDGTWQSDEKYATIHRLALDQKYKGSNIGVLMMVEIERVILKNKVYSIRVDTHQDNIAMRKYLLKNDFIYCGIIFLNDGHKRLAFEKNLDDFL